MADSLGDKTEKPQPDTLSQVSDGNRENGTSEQKAGDPPDSGTFKTPSFAIPSRKLAQRGPDAEISFKTTVAAPSVSKAPQSVVDKEKELKPKKEEKEIASIPAEPAAQPAEPEKEPVEKPDENKDKHQSNEYKPSPAEQLKRSQSAVPYEEPTWSCISDKPYSFEVIKNGAIIDTIDLTTKSYHVFGRLPSCDVAMEHPSLSRYHAVVQHSDGSSKEFPKGWYLYDLDSTHGTWINKNKVPPSKYLQLHVDHVLKFGGSTRLHILQGPDDDREEEAELSVKEMKDQRDKSLREAELLRHAEVEEEERLAAIQKKLDEDRGCSWGINEDVPAEEEEEEESEVNPFATLSTENENLYINDPKKSLNGYFEREGFDLPEYIFDDVGNGKRKCSIELPIDTPTGEPMVAEVVVSGKKKEAVIACALEACRILDRHGVLRKSSQESKKKKQKNWEDDDYYDSDDDTFLDRTGTVEKKRQLRMNRAGKAKRKAETYESLKTKHEELLSEMKEIEEKLEQAKKEAAQREDEDMDALDAYMSAIKSGAMDTKTKMKLKIRMMELKQEEQKVRKMMNIAQPSNMLPELKKNEGNSKGSLLSSVGKMKGFEHGKSVNIKKQAIESKPLPTSVEAEDQVEEEEEEDESDNDDNTNNDRKTKNKKTVSKQQIVVLKPLPPSQKDNTQSINVSDQLRDQSLIPGKDHKDNLPVQESESTEQSETKVAPARTQMKGPALPLAAVLERLQNEAVDMEEGESAGSQPSESQSKSADRNSKRRRKEGKEESERSKKIKSGSYDSTDPDYAVWLPPDNQAGDGKTHLNSKYGY